MTLKMRPESSSWLNVRAKDPIWNGPAAAGIVSQAGQGTVRWVDQSGAVRRPIKPTIFLTASTITSWG
jgi:hypothetical protein